MGGEELKATSKLLSSACFNQRELHVTAICTLILQEGESDGEGGRIVTTTITSNDITGNGVLSTGNGVPGSRNGAPGNSNTIWTTSTNTVVIPKPVVR